jgi:hypothetical protein
MAKYLENISQAGLTPGHVSSTWSASSGQLVLPSDYLREGVFTSQARSTDGLSWTSGGQGILVSPPGGYLTPRDALLLGALGQRFRWSGDWEDRVVRISLNHCARAMGYTTTGGKQRRQAAESIHRLTAATLTWRGADVDESDKPVTYVFDWHVLDANYIGLSGTGGGVAVILSATTVSLLAEGMLQFLTAKTARALVKADEFAARLWFFLESERMKKDGFDYRLLRPSEPVPGRFYIADVVGIGWQNHRNIKTRIAKAVKAIEAHDDRYELRLWTNKKGITYLKAKRSRRLKSVSRLPAESKCD